MSRAQELQAVLSEGEELTIVCHNNPDPDCLASALALSRIASEVGIDEHDILYSGDISHQQNRAFVNLLDIDLKPFDPTTVADRPEGSLLAFVDHSVPGANNCVPDGTALDIVIDHHPAEAIEARFVDHREELGAAATILTQYVHTPGDGTRRDARDGASVCHPTGDAQLPPRCDKRGVRRRRAPPRVHRPGAAPGTVEPVSFGRDGRRNRDRYRQPHHDDLGAHLTRRPNKRAGRGPAGSRLPATLEGVQTAIVFGVVDDTIHLSARSSDPRVHLGDALDAAFGDVGTAGGHYDVAGGEIPLGIFADYESDTPRLLDIVEQVVTARLVAELDLDNGG